MRFYEACVNIAESIGALLSDEERLRFTECAFDNLWIYDETIGLWITNHLLTGNTYLKTALIAIGCVSHHEMYWFLLGFTQQYWRLKQAELL